MRDETKLKFIEARMAELKEVFGKPPVLPGSEDIAAYEEMLRRFIECFQPQDFFETVLMKDVTDGTWEAARAGRHKVLLLDRRYRDRREAEAKRRKEWAVKKAELAKRVAAAKSEPATEPEDALDHSIEECDAILLEPATELDHNRALEATLASMEKIDKGQMFDLAKRDLALRQLEWYREGLGRRLRVVSDNFITDHANGTVAPPAQTPAVTQSPADGSTGIPIQAGMETQSEPGADKQVGASTQRPTEAGTREEAETITRMQSEPGSETQVTPSRGTQADVSSETHTEISAEMQPLVRMAAQTEDDTQGMPDGGMDTQIDANTGTVVDAPPVQP